MSRPIYRELPADAVPPDLSWDIPPQNQGQIVEVAYAERRRYASPSVSGAPYKRVRDGSTGATRYYILARHEKIDKTFRS